MRVLYSVLILFVEVCTNIGAVNIAAFKKRVPLQTVV